MQFLCADADFRTEAELIPVDDINAAAEMIRGTARSMGLEVVE